MTAMYLLESLKFGYLSSHPAVTAHLFVYIMIPWQPVTNI